MKLWQKIVAGMVIGVLIGIIFNEKATLLQPIATLYLNSLKMLMVPLIFSSIIVSIKNINSFQTLERLSKKTLFIFLTFSSLALLTAFVIGTVIKPGAMLHLTASAPIEKPQTHIGQQLVAIIPQNPIEAMSTGNVLQIMCFSLLFGFSMVLAGEKAKPVFAFFESLTHIMEFFSNIVIKITPLGVCAAVAILIGTQGIEILYKFGALISAVGVACLFHIFIVYGGALAVSRTNIFRFLKNISEPLIVAFTTTSAGAALPFSLKIAQENFGISKKIAHFILPLGATVNKGGTIIYQIITILFISQAYGVVLSPEQYLTILATTLLMSFGTPSIPGAGLIILTMLLHGAGLPAEGIILIAGLDKILDMIRTPTNVMGDCVAAVCLAKLENESLTI